MNPLLRRRAPAEELLSRDYERLKPEVLRTVGAKLGARSVQLSGDDLEAFYNEAWHAVFTKLQAGEEVDNPAGLLVTIAYRRALNEHRAQQAVRPADPEALVGPTAGPEPEARIDYEDTLRQFRQGLRQRFNRRDRQAAALCYLYEYTRPEAARIVGVTPKRMEKIMDSVAKQVGALIEEIEAGTRCSGYDSLIRAFSLSLLDPDGERYRLAHDHLEDCAACRRQVLVWRGLAGIAPPAPPLFAALDGSVAPGTSGVATADGQTPGASGTARGANRLRRLDPKVAAIACAALAVAAAAALALGSREGGTGPDSSSAGADRSAGATGNGSLLPAQTKSPEPAKRTRVSASARPRSRASSPVPSSTPRPAPESSPKAALGQAASEPPPPSEPTPSPAPEPASAPASEPPPHPAPKPAPPPPPAQPVRDGAEEFELQ